MDTLYERLGGFARVRLIVSDFYQRVLESEQLRPAFADTDMRRQIDHQTQFVSALLGGPASFSDERLARAHARLGITDAAFDEIRLLLVEALEDAGVGAGDVARVAAQLDTLRPRIVSAAIEAAP
jgi:hemoglobin